MDSSERFAIALRDRFAQLGGLRDVEPLRNVAADGIVRAGLIREQVGHHAAARQFGNHVRAISDQADGRGFAFAHGILQDAQRLVEIVHHHIAVAGLHAALDAFRVHVNSQERRAIQRGGQRLRAAHAAHAAGHDQVFRRGRRRNACRAAAANVSYVPCKIPCVPI